MYKETQALCGRFGGVAQLGEHLPCKQGVRGSNPLISTNQMKVAEKLLPDGEQSKYLVSTAHSVTTTSLMTSAGLLLLNKFRQ